EVSCMADTYVSAHEFGHSQGLRHAHEDPNGGGGFSSSSWGYKGPGGNSFHTIMAYDCSPSPCPAILRFSNPDLTYNGLATGVADWANNAAALDATRVTASNFRLTKRRGVDQFFQTDNGRLSHLAIKGLFTGPDALGAGSSIINDVTFLTGPGAMSSAPSAVSWGPGRLDVNWFRDATHMDHAFSDDGTNFGLNSWDPSGLVVGSSTVFHYLYKPAIASQRLGRLDMFATTSYLAGATQGTVIRRSWDNGNDTGWYSWYWDTPAASAPAAVGWTYFGTPRVDVFWLDANNHLFHTYTADNLVDFGGSDDWGPFNGEVLVGDPAVASWGDSRLDVLVNTRSGKVAHWWWDHGWGGQNIWAGPSS